MHRGTKADPRGGIPVRAALSGMAALIATGCAGPPPPPAPPPAPPAAHPNIVLISLDTFRADRMSCYGYDRLTTPRVDSLVAEGALFEAFYSASDFTLPSHASLFTGRYPSVHGVTQNEHALCDAIPVLAEHLAERGYRTVGFYDNDFLSPAYGFGRGFARYDRFSDSRTLRELWETLPDLISASDETPSRLHRLGPLPRR
ncbi:MAG: hypothetical protein CME06_02125 [Gemmatimonadetes bacterium]|nr:hypothetical protein [Gemmatimonadota bacterium]